MRKVKKTKNNFTGFHTEVNPNVVKNQKLTKQHGKYSN